MTAFARGLTMLAGCVAVVLFCRTRIALAVEPTNPAIVIDGHLDEPVWRSLPVEKLIPSQTGVPAEIGGEVRTVVVGRYLYVGARLFEPTGRITARLIGRNPSWEDEDLLKILCGPDIGYTDRILQINPWGAYSIEKALHIASSYLDIYPYSLEKPTSQVLYKNASKFLVAAAIGEHEWTVEAAIPLNEMSAPCSDRIMVRIERVRAARPGSPQQRWHWPEQGPAAKVVVLPSKWDESAPVFRPPLIGNSEPPLKVGRTTALPAMESGWDDSDWRKAPTWTLLRNEPAPRPPRFATEIKAVQDGRWLAVFARCVEPGEPIMRVKENDGPLNHDDSFQVYLATSGSSYTQFVVNPAGYLLDNTGFFGGERLSRAREWNSGARVLAKREGAAWTVRIDIPLEPVARILGDDGVPAEWRVLFRRVRQGRKDEPEEESLLPVTHSDTPLCTPRYQRFDLVEAEPSTLTSPPPRPAPSGLAALEARVLSPEEQKNWAIAQMLNHSSPNSSSTTLTRSGANLAR